MKSDSLLNIKEYLHLTFLLCLFFGGTFIFDLTVESQRAQSLLIIVLVGALYYFQTDQLKIGYWSFSDERKTTNYEIVGPFGMVLVACWIALIDYMTPDVISKYTGIIIFVTMINAMAVNSELSQRAQERFVSDRVVFAHKAVLWLFFIVLYLIATRYFLIYGTWERGVPEIVEIFESAFGAH